MTIRADIAARAAAGFLLLPILATGRVAAQDEAAQPEAPVLKASEIKSLQRSLRDWYKTDIQANAKLNEAHELKSNPKKRGRVKKLRKEAASLRKKARASKRKFRDAFAKQSQRAGGLLKHVGDLLAIFDGCFPYKLQANGGIVKEKWIDRKKKLGYAVRYPKGYKPGRSWPVLYVLPMRDRAGKGWVNARKYLELDWPKTAQKAFEEFIVVVPTLPADMDLSARVDPTKEDADEAERRNWFLSVLGDRQNGVFNQFQVDTDRVYLEATGKAAPFALRIATLFPDRFGGLILKNPSPAEVDAATMLENLNQTGVLVLANTDGRAAAKALVAALETAAQKNVKLEEVTGDLPFAGATDLVTKWVDGTKRHLFKRKVVLTPAHDRFRKAFWIEVTGAAYLSQVALSERPHVEVTADRTANRIEIKGRNVTEVRLLLNDLLVDLDKKITVVLNGQVRELQRRRSLPLIADTHEGLVVIRNDPRYLFVAQSRFNLPEVKTGDKSGGEDGSDGEAGKAASAKKDR